MNFKRFEEHIGFLEDNLSEKSNQLFEKYDTLYGHQEQFAALEPELASVLDDASYLAA